MARKSSSTRLLLDTSAVVHHLHGHTLQKAAVRKAVGDSELIVLAEAETLREITENARRLAERPAL